MATTVEEILVKFTGDASSLAKATDTSRLKTKDLEEEVLQLNRVLEHVQKTGKKPIHIDKAFENAEKAARNYRLELERLNKSGSGGGGSKGGGFGLSTSMGGVAGLSVAGAFGLGAALTAIRAAGQAVTPAISALAQEYIGLKKILHDYNEEVKRSAVLEHDQARAMGMSEARADRAARHMIDPRTGEADTGRQLNFWQGRLGQTGQAITDTQHSLEIARRDAYDRDTVGRHLPGVGAGQQMEYETAQQRVKELESKLETLKSRRDAETNKVADLEAGGNSIQRLEKSLKIEQHRLEVQLQTTGLLKESDRFKIEGRAKLDLAMDNAGRPVGDEEMKEVNDLLEKQYQLLVQIEKKKEETGMKERLRQEGFKMAARGFRGVEAEVLARNAEGKHDGNAEMLANAYTLEADALNQKYLPAAQKAQIEIARLNMLKERGVLTSHAYEMAIRDVSRTLGDGDRRAAPRQATLAGSAEHYGRMDEYARTMGQPAADKANLERAMKENNPTVKAIQDGNAILRLIVEGQKKFIPFKPANVE